MKPVLSSSCLAIVLSCTAMLSVAHAENAADKSSGEAAATPAAAAKPADKSIEIPETVAVVNGEKISKAELQTAFDNAVKMSGMDVSKLPEEQKLAGYHKLLDDLITEKILKAKAAAIKITDADVTAEIEKIKKNFPDEKTFQEQMKQAGLDEEKLRAQLKSGLAESKWIKAQIEGKAEVTDADVEAFYKANIKEFEQPEQVRASHILIRVPEGASAEDAKKKEAAAQAAYERVKKGEDFAKVADELSEDPGNKGPDGKGNGGDLNYFGKGQMVPEFDAKVFSMKKGEISEPVKTDFGYHIIKVTDKKDAHTLSLDEVKDQLTAYLKNQKQQAAVQGVIESARAEAKIKNNLPELKAPSAASTPAGEADQDAAPESSN